MRKSRFEKQKERRVHIAQERISILMDLAEREALEGHLQRASRYGALARKIGKRYNTRMPGDFKLRFCKHCSTYRVPGLNTRNRIVRGRLVIQCLNCNTYYRKPIRRKGGGNTG